MPYRQSDGWRAAAGEYVRDRYAAEHPDWELVVGDCGTDRWVKAYAITDALTRTDADLLVVADADCVVHGLERAVAAVHDGAPWAVPHQLVHRLNGPSTAHFLAHGVPHPDECEEKGCPYLGVEGGGVVVLPRATYERVPMDPRFWSWSLEDVCWGMALKVLAGPPARFDAPLIHLWHPPQDRQTRNTPRDPYAADLASQYRSAYRRWERRLPEGTAMMEALIAEAKGWLAAA